MRISALMEKIMLRKTAMAGVLTLSLTGCGGSGSGAPPAPASPPEDAFNFLATSYVGAEARLSARSNTAFVAPFIEGMPTTGTATYEGNMSVAIATPGENTVLYGVAVVDADFATSSLTGTGSGFVGQDREGSFDHYAGTIGLTDGKIGINRPNDFRVEYSGILTGNDEAIGLSGMIEGDFKGDPIRGLLGEDLSPIAVLDGVIFPAEIRLAVEVQ